jgi:threonine aldolase
MKIIDLRSDTVTKPDTRMRQAMANAEVGDDVYGEDPTVERLQDSAAERLGFEASIFTPTGSMGNQIALQLHTSRGDDVIVESQSHVVLYELGGIAAWAGALPRTVKGERGCMNPEDLRSTIAPPTYYLAQARLLVLENTHNHAGGVVLPLDLQHSLQAVAREHGLALHLDGARIFHAALAQGVEASDCASGFDTVMFCLSKGLGAPVGSLLCGSRDAIREARVIRKRMGGGMRQTGILAAAGLCALDNIPDLAADHDRARRLAAVFAEGEPFHLDESTVETNIVVVEIGEAFDALEILAVLEEEGVRAIPMGPGRLRFVTHRDIDDQALERAIEAVRRVRDRVVR